MSLTRRQSLILPAAAVLTSCTSNPIGKSDGVGPNRGVVAVGRKGKQTCDNSEVPVSDPATRISAPGDFTGQGCQMIADSYEGPYFTCAPAPGKDISYGQPGQPLSVAIRLVDGNCQPVPGGVIDVWACNATGHYSGYGNDPNGMPASLMLRAVLFGHIEPDLEHRFCRGALRTDVDGIAEFDTIYPGFYHPQPIHVHFKAHVDGVNLLTSQANLDEAWNERILQTSPYNEPRSARRNTEETGFSKMRIIERGEHLLAVLDLVVPT